VLAESIKFEYMHKSNLNVETRRFYRVFYPPIAYDISCIVSSHEIDYVSEVDGFTMKLKTFVKGSVDKMQRDIKSKFDYAEKLLDKS